MFFPPNVYLFLRERERESKQGRGKERGGQMIWSRFCPDSREPDAGLELMNCEIMSWAEVGRFTDWAIQVPLKSFLNGRECGLMGGKILDLQSKGQAWNQEAGLDFTQLWVWGPVLWCLIILYFILPVLLVHLMGWFEESHDSEHESVLVTLHYGSLPYHSLNWCTGL